MHYAKLYQAVTENLNTAVFTFDRRLHLTYINPAGEMLLAISARQARGMRGSDLFQQATAFMASLKRALSTRHPFSERELPLRLLDDTPITVDCMVTPLSEERLLVEMLRVDRQLRIARDENRLSHYQANQMMLRGLAHEINNPLGGLRGAAQLLERKLNDASLQEYTRVIIGEADRLRALLSRMLAPTALPQRRLVNIHEVLERVRSLVLAETPDGITLARDYDPSIPEFMADSDQLIQAVLNIVRNAAQALEGKGKITLRTRAHRQFTIGQKCHKLVIGVEISDDGPGIPEDLIENIFYPLVTGRADGSGLGLSIAQSLINQHGGMIECASRPGRTTFTLWLPIDNGAQHD